jgi:hypothetical protein
MRAWQACNGDLKGMARRPCLRNIMASWDCVDFLVPSWYMCWWTDGWMDGRIPFMSRVTLLWTLVI